MFSSPYLYQSGTDPVLSSFFCLRFTIASNLTFIFGVQLSHSPAVSVFHRSGSSVLRRISPCDSCKSFPSRSSCGFRRISYVYLVFTRSLSGEPCRISLFHIVAHRATRSCTRPKNRHSRQPTRANSNAESTCGCIAATIAGTGISLMRRQKTTSHIIQSIIRANRGHASEAINRGAARRRRVCQIARRYPLHLTRRVMSADALQGLCDSRAVLSCAVCRLPF